MASIPVPMTPIANMKKGEARKLARKCSHFFRSIPGEEDFLEEKQTAIPAIAHDLSRAIPEIRAIIAFGWTVGDIDLGIILERPMTIEEIRKNIPTAMIEKHPMVDWEGLAFFRSISGREIVEKMVLSRYLAAGPLQFEDPFQSEYVEYTITRAHTVYGDETYLKEMIDEIKDHQAEIRQKVKEGKVAVPE